MSGPVDIPSVVAFRILQEMKNSITDVLTLLENTFNKIDLARVDRKTIKELRAARHATQATLSMYEKSYAMIKELKDAFDNSNTEGQLTKNAQQFNNQLERERAEIDQLKEENYELESQKIEIQTNMGQTEFDHQQETVQSKTKMIDLEDNTDEVNTRIQLEAANQSVAELKGKLGVQEGRLAALNDKLIAQDVKEKISQLSITDLVNDKAQLCVQLRDSDYSRGVAEEQSRGLEMNLKDMAKTVTKSEDKIKELETKNEQLQTEIRNAKDAYTSIQLALSIANFRLEDTAKTVVKGDDKINELEAEKKHLQMEKLKAIDASTSDNRSFKTLNTKLDDTTTSLDKDLDNSFTRLSALLSSNASLGRDLEVRIKNLLDRSKELL